MPDTRIGSAAALVWLLLGAATAVAQPDCVRCDLLYGSTGGDGSELYELDPRSGALRVIGPVESYSDLALTPDARLLGLGRGGRLVEIDACDAAEDGTEIFTIRPGATGTTRTGELLVSGAFLQHVDLVAETTTNLPSGGWCGFAAGDLALNPCSGEAWQVSRGPDCPCPDGDTLLQVIDPVTGDHLRDLTCLPFTAIFGLAFDSSCTAWLVDADTGSLVRVDGATAEWEVAPAPDLSGTLGFASLPCAIEGRCDAGGPYEAPCGPRGVATVLLDGSDSSLPSAEPLEHEWTVRCAGTVVATASGETAWVELPAGCDELCEVELHVANAEGRELECRTTALLRDEQPPRLDGVPDDAVVECDAVPAPASVSASDDCDPAPRLELDERRVDGPCPGEYLLERRWRAVDACGLEAEAVQVLDVRDRTPPVVEPRGGVAACLWPPSHGFVRVEASLFAPRIAETCSGPVTWRLSGCVSDEPEDGLGDGRTEPDCVVADDGEALLVRAERLGNEDGRVYSALVVATDACGNASEPTLAGRIRVAHDRREQLDCLRSVPRGRTR